MTRRPRMTTSEADWCIEIFRAGKSVSEVERITGHAFDLKTLGHLKALAGREVL